MTDFRGLLAALRAAKVDFVVVGGVAATVHGSARLTSDLDVVYSRDPKNLARLAQALLKLKPYPRGAPEGLPFRWDERTIRAGLNFTLTTDLGDLDLLGEVSGGGCPRPRPTDAHPNEARGGAPERLRDGGRAGGDRGGAEVVASGRKPPRGPLAASQEREAQQDAEQGGRADGESPNVDDGCAPQEERRRAAMEREKARAPCDEAQRDRTADHEAR